jgi:hypothetical protein
LRCEPWVSFSDPGAAKSTAKVAKKTQRKKFLLATFAFSAVKKIFLKANV